MHYLMTRGSTRTLYLGLDAVLEAVWALWLGADVVSKGHWLFEVRVDGKVVADVVRVVVAWDESARKTYPGAKAAAAPVTVTKPEEKTMQLEYSGPEPLPDNHPWAFSDRELEKPAEKTMQQPPVDCGCIGLCPHMRFDGGSY